jgi:VanZ family protein
MASSSIVFGIYPQQPFPRSSLKRQIPLQAWLPVLACLLLLAVESTPYLGADHTSAPLRRIAESLFGYDACVHWNPIHCLIRKTGHFLGFAFFSLACFHPFWMAFQGTASPRLRQLRAHGLAILAAFLAASADELHQCFLPNRTGLFSDVLLDTCGAAAMCFLLFLAMQAVEWGRQARLRPSRETNPVLSVRW